MKKTLAILLFTTSFQALADAPDFQFIAEDGNRFSAIQYGARWPDGVIRWRYNPSGQPAGITTADAIATLQSAFRNWTAGCNLREEYQGTTDATVISKDGITAIGWGDAKGYAGYTNIWWNGDYQMTEGDIVFNAQKLTDTKSLLSNATHEIGHLLGLTHSDQPQSIMFSNPYHSSNYQLQPKGDDLSVCALLYGSNGVVSYTDLGTQAVQSQSAYTLSFYLSATKPTAFGPPAAPLTGIPADSNDTIYFIVNYSGIPIGRQLKLQLVSPDGFNYSDYEWNNTYKSAYYYTTWNWAKNLGMQRLPGTWKLQLLDEGLLVGEQPFTVQSDYPAPTVPQLALVATVSGDGNVTFSAQPLRSADKLTDALWMLDQKVVSGGSTAPGSGTHTLWLAATSSNSRYQGTIPDSSSQDSGPDNGLRIDQLTAQPPAAAKFGATGSGTRAALSLDVNWQIADSGKQQLYVAAVLGQSVFFKTATGWTATPQALLEASGPGWVAANVLKRDDVRALPSGIPIYAGYGTSLDEMLAKQKLGVVFSLP